jgi:hypothetical protein
VAVCSAHTLVHIVQHRFLKGATGIAAGVDKIVCVDDSDDVFEFVDPRFFNKWCSIPLTVKMERYKI